MEPDNFNHATFITLLIRSLQNIINTFTERGSAAGLTGLVLCNCCVSAVLQHREETKLMYPPIHIRIFMRHQCQSLSQNVPYLGTLSIRAARPTHQNMYHQKSHSQPKLMGVQKRHFYKRKLQREVNNTHFQIVILDRSSSLFEFHPSFEHFFKKCLFQTPINLG